MSGFLAWLAWLVVHIWYLIGFRNRLVVMITWAWSYFTYRRGARLILGRGPVRLPLESIERKARVESAGGSAVAASEHVDETADGPVVRVEGARPHRAHLPTE
jgi:hypothetical protein